MRALQQQCSGWGKQFFCMLAVLQEVLCVMSIFKTYNDKDNVSFLLFQFVEIKGSVFKKFEKNNLFQMSNSGMYR